MMARRLAVFVRGRVLVPVAHLHTHRRRKLLVDAAGATLAEITEDRATARTIRPAESADRRTPGLPRPAPLASAPAPAPATARPSAGTNRRTTDTMADVARRPQCDHQLTRQQKESVPGFPSAGSHNRLHGRDGRV